MFDRDRIYRTLSTATLATMARHSRRFQSGNNIREVTSGRENTGKRRRLDRNPALSIKCDYRLFRKSAHRALLLIYHRGEEAWSKGNIKGLKQIDSGMDVRRGRPISSTRSVQIQSPDWAQAIKHEKGMDSRSRMDSGATCCLCLSSRRGYTGKHQHRCVNHPWQGKDASL